MTCSQRKHFYDTVNRSCRIDVFDELSQQAVAAVRQFSRRLGAPHLVDEVLLPMLAEGDCQIVAAVRDRPWPPWGLGAREIVAMCTTQMIAEGGSFAVSPVYALPAEITNVGMISAVYKEALDQLAVHPQAEVCYLAAEDSTLADLVLRQAGFERTEDVFVTWQERYNTYRAPVQKVLAALRLDKSSAPDLLSYDIAPEALRDQALFHQTVNLGSMGEWLAGDALRSELIRLVRGGHASKPGGVPSGTGRWEIDMGDPSIVFAVSIANALGPTRDQLLEYAVKSESRFRPADLAKNPDGPPQVDERLRRARVLDDLGPFADTIKKTLLAHLEPALKRLQHSAFPLGNIEMQITASSDGDYFRLHSDADAQSTREISFVYYFYHEPRRFSGGELRLYESKLVDGKLLPSDHPQTLSPRQDMLLLFPSRNDHEVLPVRVPSGEFADSRFTVNGWIHRQA